MRRLVRQSRRAIIVAGVALTMAATLRGDDRFVDFDRQVDFSMFRTFAIRPGAVESDAPELTNALTRKAVDDAIRARLFARKLVERPDAVADLIVDWSVGAEPKRGSRPLRPGRPRRVPFTYTQGTLVIEMTTRQSRLVWHGTYRDDESNPAKIAERLPRNVTRLLDDYPPRR